MWLMMVTFETKPAVKLKKNKISIRIDCGKKNFPIWKIAKFQKTEKLSVQWT